MNNYPFVHLPSPSLEHFKLSIYAAVLRLIEQVVQACGSLEAAFEQFPFLIGYHNELAANGLEGLSSDQAETGWRDILLAREEKTKDHLPLRALREAASLDHDAITLLLSIGLIEEDGRFGSVFETVQNIPGQHRPTIGLLSAWWRKPGDGGEERVHIRCLQELGLIQIVNPEAPRWEWALQVPALVWEALRGERHEVLEAWGHYYAPEQLLVLEEMIVPESLRQDLATIPRLLARGEARTLIVTGPQHNGRRMLLGAIARSLGCGVLLVNGLQKEEERHLKLLGPLATLMHALPVIVLDLAPGETAELPALRGYHGPLGVVLGKQGGVSGPGAERAITLTLEMPNASERLQHWQRAVTPPLRGARGMSSNTTTHAAMDLKEDENTPRKGGMCLDQISSRFRMTSGNIRRAASLAQAYAALAERSAISMAEVQQAARALNRQALDTLAARVETNGDWSHLAVNAETLAELRNLETRCRHREHLQEAVGPAFSNRLNCGVRALFSGPSGTGKTLAARLLAASLQMDLYRLDLSAVVNKYIGETEKNLHKIFSRAEELDVILLLDEGDALLTQRTSVQTSNDRYANLETNYLLQRLESFEGILLVTTNASANIDAAFQRRMDVLVEFRAPEASERWAIWQLHLPAEHQIAPALLEEVAQRCALNGGQIRNAVLHAALLARNNGGVMTSSYVQAAVQREYRKQGAACPLRRF